MANEHAHRFWTTAPDLPRCSCGKTLLDLYNETEQQLAQAQEILDYCIIEISHEFGDKVYRKLCQWIIAYEQPVDDSSRERIEKAQFYLREYPKPEEEASDGE